MDQDNRWDGFHMNIFLIAQRTKVHLNLWLSNCCVYCSTSDNEEAMRGLGICQTFYDKVKWQMPFDLDKIPPTVGKDNYQNGFMLFIFRAIQKMFKITVFPLVDSSTRKPVACGIGKINFTLSGLKCWKDRNLMMKMKLSCHWPPRSSISNFCWRKQKNHWGNNIEREAGKLTKLFWWLFW